MKYNQQLKPRIKGQIRRNIVIREQDKENQDPLDYYIKSKVRLMNQKSRCKYQVLRDKYMSEGVKFQYDDNKKFMNQLRKYYQQRCQKEKISLPLQAQFNAQILTANKQRQMQQTIVYKQNQKSTHPNSVQKNNDKYNEYQERLYQQLQKFNQQPNIKPNNKPNKKMSKKKRKQKTPGKEARKLSLQAKQKSLLRIHKRISLNSVPQLALVTCSTDRDVNWVPNLQTTYKKQTRDRKQLKDKILHKVNIISY